MENDTDIVTIDIFSYSDYPVKTSDVTFAVFLYCVVVSLSVFFNSLVCVAVSIMLVTVYQSQRFSYIRNLVLTQYINHRLSALFLKYWDYFEICIALH